MREREETNIAAALGEQRQIHEAYEHAIIQLDNRIDIAQQREGDAFLLTDAAIPLSVDRCALNDLQLSLKFANQQLPRLLLLTHVARMKDARPPGGGGEGG